MRRQGLVQALLEILRQEDRPGPGKLVGRLIPHPSKGTELFVAIDEVGHLHFLLSPAATKTTRFDKLKLKTLFIENRKWTVAGHPTGTYLDLNCKAGLGSPFINPFNGLCEDILILLRDNGISTEEAVYRTVQKWKRFWSTKILSGFTVEWLHGLHGEVTFLEQFVRQHGSKMVLTWSGPEGQDHDFQARKVGFEVKTSARLPLTIQVNNLGQLDESLFDNLFVACFHIVDGEEGVSLPETVLTVEELLQRDEEMLEVFHEKLERAGYNPRQSEDYDKVRYSMTGPAYFPVDGNFPKITQVSFTEPLDSRITKIRYAVELRGMKELKEDSLPIRKAKAKFSGKD